MHNFSYFNSEPYFMKFQRDFTLFRDAIGSSVQRHKGSSEKRQRRVASTLSVEAPIRNEGRSVPDRCCQYLKMANMKMANPIKGLVSKKKKRYTQDGFDLDLTYICNNLIAMGFPAEKLEGVYRNHIDDVKKFLESKHKDHYKIYNLCSERSYDTSKFKERVANYPFDDHNPPKLEDIKPFCADVHAWLEEDERNVAAVHCKAGKGRTGVMVCCYMLHAKMFPTASEALNYYGQMRTTDEKGVTIPSQRRYVEYYASLVQEQREYQPVTLQLIEIKLEPLPVLNGAQGSIVCTISMASSKIFTSPPYEVKKGAPSLTISIKDYVLLEGDVKVEFFSKSKISRKERLFQFWINTYFIRDEVKRVPECRENGNDGGDRSARPICNELSRQSRHSPQRTSDSDNTALKLQLSKWQLDLAHKDKTNSKFPTNFQVQVLCKKVRCTDPRWRRSVPLPSQRGNSKKDVDSSEPSTGDEEEEEDGWESVDSTERKPGQYRLLGPRNFCPLQPQGQLFES